MDPEFIKSVAALIGAIAWPSIVLLVLLMYRKSVQKMLENLESLTLPGGFQAKLRNAVEKESRAVIEANPNAPKLITPEQLVASERVGELAVKSDLSMARQQMVELARQYERVRAAMPASDSRTQQMDFLVTKMRTLAVACRPFLPDFTRSDSPGERLAAIAILQVTPDLNYVDWLAERFKVEKHFIEYHAAVALQTSVRIAGPVNRDAVEKAILTAQETLGKDSKTSDLAKVLDMALRELRAQ